METKTPIEGDNAAVEQYDGLVLMSGGLDSILTYLLLRKQGLKLLGVHYYSPFFGAPQKAEMWKNLLGIEAICVDTSDKMIKRLYKPHRGFGKTLNPCVDCKINMITQTKAIMDKYGAKFVATGEVLGQRPMSQHMAALNNIKADTGMEGKLLRPLSAKLLEETDAERSGLVDREQLLSLQGRGRKGQMALVEQFKVPEEVIESPAGGCRLTDETNATRYAQLLTVKGDADATDFRLCNFARHYWKGEHWVVIGRNEHDNDQLLLSAAPTDYTMRLETLMGPIALLRPIHSADEAPEIIAEAAQHMASFSKHARDATGPVRVSVTHGEKTEVIEVTVERRDDWLVPIWATAKAWKVAKAEEGKQERWAEKREARWAKKRAKWAEQEQ
ncbi:Thiamine biosynthesis protein (ThiI) [Carpediemonas membranifera]|uniref:Thiamine biosynthesis protein (ThiI) n=1 Tax=Carpediemonas membranifera TaxID=201153 RepID=A0A8J6B6I5_9EUKA|nr:Thiamine biosynthesis protein (ThiI) [Carpediemonas membranifera]|eukprot:KAG9391017.1 Thiamine biosynthesis protein (ThiI) [Carpediemonas membranifera]